MRLYTTKLGPWYGTQADAKKSGFDWVEVDVPTVKQELLEFLNTNDTLIRMGRDMEMPTGEGRGSTGTRKPYVAPYDPDAPARLDEPPKQGITCSAYKPASDLNAYDVRDVVTVCDRKHLGQALGTIISRLHDELDTAVEILEVAS